MANKLKEFISYLEEQVENHSIYVWGAQGQQGSAVTEAWIKKRETSEANFKRAVAFWKKQCEAGFGDVLRAFDCSGLGSYWLQNVKHIIPGDTNANGFYGKCKKISKSALRVGDFVFKTTIGRCDLEGGNFQEMLSSIKKIKQYPKEITLYPGHGEKTTLDFEIQNNPYFKSL